MVESSQKLTTALAFRAFVVRVTSHRRLGKRIVLLDTRHGIRVTLPLPREGTALDHAVVHLLKRRIRVDGVAERGVRVGPLILSRDLTTTLR